MMTFHAAVPGAWPRDDIANIFTALAKATACGGDYGAGYEDALLAAATALGLYARPAAGPVLPPVVLIDAAGREVRR